MIDVNKEYRISYKLYNDISLDGINKNGDVEVIEEINLSELEDCTDSKSSKIKADLKDIFYNINSVEDTLKEEIKLLKDFERFKNNIDIAKHILDVDWMLDYVNNFEEDLLRIENEYLTSDPLELKKRDEKTSFIVELWRTNLESKYNNIIYEVWKYFINKIQDDSQKQKKV